jgi:hypothetical protein
VPIKDSETGVVQLVSTFSKKIKNNYENKYREHVLAYEELFSKNGAGHLSCSVEESYVKKLLGYFKARL